MKLKITLDRLKELDGQEVEIHVMDAGPTTTQVWLLTDQGDELLLEAED